MRLIDADALIETMYENAEGNEGWYGDTWQFMRDIEHAPTIDVEPHWISCEERLPETTGKYLVSVKNGNVYANVFDGFSKKFQCAAVAWMPLPKPYAERKDDE